MQIDLNADLGEGAPNDEALLQLVSSANIACGYHAGDADMMRQSVRLAIKYGVNIGAHPSFFDRENFGRSYMEISPETAFNIVLYQVGALDAIVKSEGGVMSHVKPHGMFYNQAAQDPVLANAIAKAVYTFNPKLKLMGLSGGELTKAAVAIGLTPIEEVFADRRYESTGALVARTHPLAMIDSTDLAISQTIDMIKFNRVQAIDDSVIDIKAQSVCLHGDGEHALVFARALRASLQNEKIHIAAVS